MKKSTLSGILLIALLGSCSVLELDDSSGVDPNDQTSATVVITNVSGSATGTAASIGSLPDDLGIDTTKSASVSFKSTIPPTPGLPADKRLEMNTLLANQSAIDTGSPESIDNLTTKGALANSLGSDPVTFTGYTYNSSGSTSTTTLTGNLKYTGTYCYIYVDQNSSASASTNWTAIGQEFDNTIYPTVTKNFATPSDVDSNGKIAILYYDMGESSILGFFYALDLFSTSNQGYENSNQMELFYMNTDTASASNGYKPQGEELMSTLAHEFQHMVNFGYRYINNNMTWMDTWMDEGLAMAAEDLYTGTKNTYRIDWYNGKYSNGSEYSNYRIRNGHPLCAWDDSSTMAALANYSLSYLFVQYIRTQSTSDSGIYKMLVQDYQNGDYRDVEELMTSENSSFSSFSQIIKSWRVANILQESSGLYGYNDDSTDFELDTKIPNTLVTKLKPGGSIYFNSTWGIVGNMNEDTLGASTIIDYTQIKDGSVENL